MNKGFIFLIMLFALAGCGAQSEEVIEETVIEDTSVTTNDEIEEEQTQTITFSDAITTDGTAKVEGNQVTIETEGTYLLTGTSADAEVIINAPDEEVNLILNSLDLTSQNTSAITGIDAKNINITLEGESTLSDTTSNTDDYQAPLYVDEVETHISGDGTLNLNGNYQEGLESNNDLYIDGGTLNISAVDDGINAGDLLSINGGTINIDSNGDGLDSNGDLEITGGVMYVSGGNNGNGPIDYGDEGNSFVLTGGTIIAVGGNMGVTPTESTQTFLHATASGTSVAVGDLSYDSPKDFSYIFVSTPSITEDTQIQVDGITVEASAEEQSGMGGGMAPPIF